MTEHPHGHHPHGVEHRNRQNRQAERYKPEIFRYCPIECRVAAQCAYDETGHHRPHEHRAPVPDEHLRFQPEDVVEQERDQRARTDGGKARPASIPENGEKHPESDAGENAEPRAQPVHPVNHVDRIDDSHPGKYGQRQGDPCRQPADAPQPVEIVHAESCSIPVVYTSESTTRISTANRR